MPIPGAAPTVALDYALSNYSGFDRFGRVQTQLWDEDGGPSTAVDETDHLPNADGNITSAGPSRRAARRSSRPATARIR